MQSIVSSVVSKSEFDSDRKAYNAWVLREMRARLWLANTYTDKKTSFLSTRIRRANLWTACNSAGVVVAIVGGIWWW